MTSRVVFFLSILNLGVLFTLYLKVETLGALATRQSQQTWFGTRDAKELRFREWADEDAATTSGAIRSTSSRRTESAMASIWSEFSSASTKETMTTSTKPAVSSFAMKSSPTARSTSVTPTPATTTYAISTSSSDDDGYPTLNFTIDPTVSSTTDQTSATTTASSNSSLSRVSTITRVPYSSSYSAFPNATATSRMPVNVTSSGAASSSNARSIRVSPTSSYTNGVSSSLKTSAGAASASTATPRSTTKPAVSYIGSVPTPQRYSKASQPTSVRKAVIGRYNANVNRTPPRNRARAWF